MGLGRSRDSRPSQRCGLSLKSTVINEGELMTSNSRARVTVRVHLGGIVAYVPDPCDLGLWALLPAGLEAEPAAWRLTTERQRLISRPAHFALLIADYVVVVRPKTTAEISTVIEPWDVTSLPSTALYPLTSSRKVVSFITGRRLIFDIEGPELRIRHRVKRFVPSIDAVAPSHSTVDRHYFPGDKNFDPSALSSAFIMNTGILSVGGFFGEDGNAKVDFGRVEVGYGGALEFKDRTWKKRVANHLVWSITLPRRKRYVTIKSIAWMAGDPNPDSEYVLEAPPDKNEIELAILNTEMEVPMLFREDAALPPRKFGFPDPDFDLIYKLSSNQAQPEKKKFPIPNSGTTGKFEKTCSGGLYSKFG
jgi:hypothetical protein